MRASHITSWLSERGGGIPPVIWGLSREMGLAGVDCLVAGLSNDPGEIKGQGSHTTILTGKSKGAFGYSNELRRKISANIVKDSIIHSHGLWMYPGVIARKEATLAGATLVISAHGMLDVWALKNSAFKKRMAGWLFENRNLRQAACLHALCEAEAQSYRDYGLRNPICIIPNGIDLPPAAESLGLKAECSMFDHFAHGRKVLLYLGRIHPKKGLANLIRAWATVRSSEWILVIAGWDQGAHETELKRLCAELGISFTDVQPSTSNLPGSDSVYFVGPQFGDGKAACYSHCDAFILPSVSEGLPMVILEAWAYGKPALMTPQCNLPEGFAAQAAIQIEPNVESIATRLNFLFQASDDQLKTMGKNGRSLVTARFNWARCAQEMIEVYRWLLDGGAKPSAVI